MPVSQPEPLDAAAYARVFEGFKEGSIVLEELLRIFARPPKLDGGIDAVLATYYRAGQRSVLDHIISKINRANGVPDDDHDE